MIPNQANQRTPFFFFFAACNVKNYKEELDIFYGDNSNSDESPEDDESDGFM
jgi:hypothetical protein